MKSKIGIVFLFFIVVVYLFNTYIQNLKQKDIDNILTLKTESLKVSTRAILDTYYSVTKKFYFDITHNDEIMEMLKRFKTSSENEKKILRGKLYRKLYKEYKLLQELSVYQFHFHTFDGKSLLRFDQPYLNGDALIDFRKSIKNAVINHKETIGLEAGRVYSGFRYVFPILSKDKGYLGSVEFSISFDALKYKLISNLNLIDAKFIIKKSESYDKVFKHLRALFSKSIIDDDYYIERVSYKQKDIFIKIIKELKKQYNIKKLLSQQKNFSLPIIYDGNGYSLTFLDMKNTSGESIGYIVAFDEFERLLDINKKYSFLFEIGILILMMLFALIIVVLYQFDKLKSDTKKLQKLIDLQESIVILTDGNKFEYANKSFLEFFGYETFEEFLKEHNCICEYFEDKDDFFSLDKIKQGEKNWIESLLNIPLKQRVVYIKDKDGIAHMFNVNISKYDNETYIVSFNDISDTIREKYQLQKQVVKDKLTDVYNRSYFESNIHKLIKFYKSEDLKLGIIFFDIDFFKSVNDTYGHDVGDYVLKTLADIVKNNIRKTDKLIRWGGEEFIVIASVNNLEELYILAEHLRNKVQDFRFDKVEKITCSFGLAIHKDDIDIYKTVKLADKNLYMAKQSGRNKVIS